MAFMRFFKPKWQHSNPDVRRQAVEALAPENDDVLMKIALKDEVPEIRKVALGRIHDLIFLNNLVDEEQDQVVKEFATRRLSELLAGVDPKSQPLDIRQDFITQHQMPETLEFVALQGVEPELRQLAQGQVKREEVLGEVAVKDPVIANRLAALERITDLSVLETVFRQTRKHDKQINRLSRTKLDALKEEQEQAARNEAECTEICNRLEKMGQGDAWDEELTEFERLEERWKVLSAETQDKSCVARYATARDAFLKVSATYREAREIEEQKWASARNVRHSILTEVAKCRVELENLQDLNKEAESQYKTGLGIWQTAWNEVPELPEAQALPLNATYQQDLDAIQSQIGLLRHRRETQAALDNLVNEAQQLLDAKRPISENQIKSLDKRWEAKQGSPEAKALVDKIEQYKTLHKQLRARLTQQLEKRQIEFEKLPGMLDKLEALMNDKVLKEAGPIHDRIQSSLSHLQALGMPKDKLAPFANRLHRVTPQIRELQSWRTWGADEARERLCDEMEALIGSEEKPSDLASQIRRLRTEWDRLRSDGGATGKTLRKRFDKAANEAYKPCEVFFKQQADQRSTNLEKKQELLQQLEAYLGSAEWSHMDWKAAVKFQRQFINDWRRAGPVDRREAKEVDGHYQKSMGVLNEHLELEHKRNLTQRKALIEKVRALMDVADINKAIDECKQLQTQWQTSVPGKRQLENEIWQEFRDACDAVFARRKQEQDERHAEEQQHKAKKQEICITLEQLAESKPAELDAADRQIHKLITEWKEVGAVAKRDAAALEQRFEKAQKSFRQHKEVLLEAEEKAQLKLLQEKAELCRELEQLLESSGSVTELESIDERWSNLTPLSDASTDELIHQRYTRVSDALRDSTGEKQSQLLEELKANLESRNELCLRMEILSGVESPPELKQARMEYQANRLAEAMGQGEEDPVGKIAELERSWCLTGGAPASEEALLQQRFNKAHQPID